MASLVMLTPALSRAALLADFHAAFADFLRVDVANGDASPDTMRNYRNEVAAWVGWCAAQSFDPATVTPTHIKRYRQALLEAGYKPITIRWKLTIVRRFYEAARNAGLRTDNPAAGVKSPRVRQATEDFKYLCDEELARLLDAIPDPEQAIGREKVRRLRNLLMVSMMALQALRTIEVHRSNVEDLLEKGEQLTLLVRGKTRDRIAYLRPDMGRRLKQYLALRGKIERDGAGTPLFSAVGNARGGRRLSRRHIRVQTDGYLQTCPAPHGGHAGLSAHRRSARRAGLSGPRRLTHDLALRARGGHGEKESGAVHSGEDGVSRGAPFPDRDVAH